MDGAKLNEVELPLQLTGAETLIQKTVETLRYAPVGGNGRSVTLVTEANAEPCSTRSSEERGAR